MADDKQETKDEKTNEKVDKASKGVEKLVDELWIGVKG